MCTNQSLTLLFVYLFVCIVATGGSWVIAGIAVASDPDVSGFVERASSQPAPAKSLATVLIGAALIALGTILGPLGVVLVSRDLMAPRPMRRLERPVRAPVPVSVSVKPDRPDAPLASEVNEYAVSQSSSNALMRSVACFMFGSVLLFCIWDAWMNRAHPVLPFQLGPKLSIVALVIAAALMYFCPVFLFQSLNPYTLRVNSTCVRIVRGRELILMVPFANVAGVWLDKLLVRITVSDPKDGGTWARAAFRGEKPGEYILENSFDDDPQTIAEEIYQRWQPFFIRIVEKKR